MNTNAPIAAGPKQSSIREKKNGRKRPRSEVLKKRFSILPLTAAGIAALCSLNGARDHPSLFAFAFFHPAPLPSIERHLKYIVANQNDVSLRKSNSHFHNKKSTICNWMLDGIENGDIDVLDGVDNEWENSDGIQNSNYGSSRKGYLDSSLVFTSSSTSSPSLPPWLACTQEEFADLSSRAGSKRIRREIELLKDSLTSFQGGNLFSEEDVKDIIRAIYWCASSNSQDRSMSQKVSKIVGCVSFCRLLLQLEDDSFDMKKNQQHNDGIENKNTMEKKGYLISKDVLLASIIHYSECVDLRYDGVYDEVQNAVYKNSFIENNDDNIRALLCESTIADDENTGNASIDMNIVLPRDASQDRGIQDASIVMRRQPTDKNSNDAFETIFSQESLKLANAATRLKRIEILTSATLASREDREIRRRPLSSSEYAAARNLMVSVTVDWRALAIRCAASLFRLEGILKNSNVNAGVGDFSRPRDAETTLTAKDSLKMYANLSQQMGLHRLHSQLESKAFRILYPRQYSASSALFQEHGAAMNAISGFLSNQLNQMLCEDLSLMYELENLEVVSRVKEPYSFWKKLLKSRIGPIVLSANNDEQCVDSNDGKSSCSIVKRSENSVQPQVIRTSPDLSILDVKDGVALRVIFKARKLHMDESPQTTLERERMLCYYIHRMVRSRWPETDLSRVKDYVRYPKPNGYQSLHHTSKITRNNQDFHFEVQVRSEEMHRLAEFGVAAHSSYKLDGSSSPNTLPPLKQSLSSSSISRASSSAASSSPITMSDSSNQSSALSILTSDENNTSNAAVFGVNDSGFSGPYIHALKKSRQSLMQTQVYAFLAVGSSSSLENSQLITLSAGSIIFDVLETILEVNDEFEFKDYEVNVWCNGNIALPEQKVKNGDMILIEPTPSSLSPITEILVNKTSSSNTILVS